MKILLRCVAGLGSFGLLVATSAAVEPADVEARLKKDLSYLASDALEGRGIDTPGIKKAADYIRERFKEYDLTSAPADGSYFQPFLYSLGSSVKKETTSVILHGPDGATIKLELGKDFQALTYGEGGKVTLPVVFVGYGISAKEMDYDDFGGIDVAGKLVIAMRRNPGQRDSNSKFAKKGTNYSGAIPKVQNAVNSKAAAILLVSDPFSVANPDSDKLVESNYLSFGGGGRSSIMVGQIKQTAVNQMLAASPLKSLKDAETAIDAEIKPHSQALTGWTAELNFDFERKDLHLNNVVGVIEGEGPHANETILLGAHYDHLGYGGNGSLAPRSKEIHNGADDNGSGTTTLIEMARRYGTRGKKPARRMVFMTFCAEERGLIGSKYYVDHPIIPLSSCVAMVNFDMVGRLREDRLTLNGIKSATEFEKIANDINVKYQFKIGQDMSVDGSSDHASFYQKGLPVYFFFTGTHPDYHRPGDKVDKINFAGMRKISDFAQELIDVLLTMPEKPHFTRPERSPQRTMTFSRGQGAALGIMPDYRDDIKGVMVSDVTEGGAAQRAGIKSGDIVTAIAGQSIENIQVYMSIIAKFKPGDKTEVTIKRGKESKNLPIVFGGRIPPPAESKKG